MGVVERAKRGGRYSHLLLHTQAHPVTSSQPANPPRGFQATHSLPGAAFELRFLLGALPAVFVIVLLLPLTLFILGGVVTISTRTPLVIFENIVI